MPFIGAVLEQVVPFVDKCVISISKRSNDGTNDVISDLAKKYPGQFDVQYEKYTNQPELTFERQSQVYRSEGADWLLFLDDDDYWPTESLKSMFELLDKPVPGIAIAPYQVLDENTHDGMWCKKWFTKWFRNDYINFRGIWPRDLVYTRNTPLYWKENNQVLKVPVKFYHLAHVKKHTFRDEEWAKNFKLPLRENIRVVNFTDEERNIINEIYIRANK